MQIPILSVRIRSPSCSILARYSSIGVIEISFWRIIEDHVFGICCLAMGICLYLGGLYLADYQAKIFTQELNKKEAVIDNLQDKVSSRTELIGKKNIKIKNLKEKIASVKKEAKDAKKDIKERKNDKIEELQDKIAYQRASQESSPPTDTTEETVEQSVDQPEENKSVSTHESHGGNTIPVHVTAYTADCPGCSGRTYTDYNVNSTIYYNGMRVLAVDPDVIPLYSIVRLHVNGRTMKGIALDIGGAIDGHDVDLLVKNKSQASHVGSGPGKAEILRRGK